MSDLKAGRVELLELDLDIRMKDLMLEAGHLAMVTRSDAKGLIVQSHWRAVEDVMGDESPESLYQEHGYRIPPKLDTPVPHAWLDDEYIPTDDELIQYYEESWGIKITDTEFQKVSFYMRAAYGAAHIMTYLRKTHQL